GGPAHERALRDKRGKALPRGRDLEDVASRKRGAPADDAFRADAVERARESDGRAPIVALALDVDEKARLAARVTEAAVVEHERREAGRSEPLREGVQACLLDAA